MKKVVSRALRPRTSLSPAQACILLLLLLWFSYRGSRRYISKKLSAFRSNGVVRAAARIILVPGAHHKEERHTPSFLLYFQNSDDHILPYNCRCSYVRATFNCKGQVLLPTHFLQQHTYVSTNTNNLLSIDMDIYIYMWVKAAVCRLRYTQPKSYI